MIVTGKTWEPTEADGAPARAPAGALYPTVVIAHAGDLALVGAQIEVPAAGLTIGRNAPEFRCLDGSALTIRDPHVSRAHLQVRWTGETFSVSVTGGLPVAGYTPEGEPGASLNALAPGSWLTLGERVLLCLTRRQRRARTADRLGFVGESEALWALRDEVRMAGQAELNVLITGETGAGKEVAAQAIHAVSVRGRVPLVSFNCGALLDGPVDVQLFGSVRGAFTGADPKKGAFERADGGAIFLDELGELPIALQPKLLRVVQVGQVVPVGGATERPVDVRLLSATHQDLSAATKNGRFREDLFFRLAQFEVRLPALRAHREDIPVLFAHFAREHAVFQGDERSSHAVRIPARFVVELIRRSWPGNVRELQNIVGRAAALVAGGQALTVASLPREGPSPAQRNAAQKSRTFGTRQAVDKQSLEDALEASRYDRAATADTLGVNRSTLYRWMRKFGLTTAPPSASRMRAAIEAADGDLSEAAHGLKLSVRALVRHARAAGIEV